MTMKMISSTSMTSTIGVTLMSDNGRRGSFHFHSLLTPVLDWRERFTHRRTAPSNSTQGSRLIADFTCWPRLLRPLEEIVDQLRARVAHFHVERLNAVGEVVEHPDGRDSDEQDRRRW